MAIGGPEAGRPGGERSEPRSVSGGPGARLSCLARKAVRPGKKVARTVAEAGRASVRSGHREAVQSLARRRRDGWSPPPEPGGPVTSVVGIMSPMPAQPFRHEGPAEAPPLQCLLQLGPFDQLKPGRRPSAGRTPKSSSQPQLADGGGAGDHGQGGPLDRLVPAAGLTGDAQQQPVSPGGLHRNEARRRRRPERPVHPKTRA